MSCVEEVMVYTCGTTKNTLNSLDTRIIKRAEGIPMVEEVRV